MSKNTANKNVFSSLKSAYITLMDNKTILFPFFIVMWVQLLCLEIIYFSPRLPLNSILGPIIQKLFGEVYLHYPFNFILLPKLYQNIQMPLYILLSSFCIAWACSIINAINNDSEIKIGKLAKKTFSQYVFLILAAILSFALVILMFKGFSFLIMRAAKLRSEAGILFLIKNIILKGTPYFQLIINILASTVFAYLIPAIAIDNKKILAALILNFKTLWKSFWFTFFLLLIPSLLYLPIVVIRSTITFNSFIPELQLIVIIASVIVMFAIDSICYTALTIHYLLKKESL